VEERENRAVRIDEVRFGADGLVPAIIQDAATGRVLMLGYMNREALQKTLDSGLTWFYSRSRKRLWQKGETSGHVQKVKRVLVDCDGDALLIGVEQAGPGTCHEGYASCFHYYMEGEGIPRDEVALKEALGERTFDPDQVYRKRS